MNINKDIYQAPLSLLTDLYQLTMAQGYWKKGLANREAVFNLFFRHPVFKGGYAISCGLHYVIDWLESFSFHPSDLDYLATLRNPDGTGLFDREFLFHLSNLKFECDVDAVPEGRLVFPQEPLLRVKGPIWQAQLIETFLLNAINFQTLIATKAARICFAAKGDAVLEFGLRRAQGIDGGLSASRASYVGGCSATSNVLAGKLFGIPVRGTHAHSWVMTFASEVEAFEAYAESMPGNAVFLVDTYNTLKGVENAILVGRKLREKGYELAGIRLDSGDLAYLSIEARRILDEAGFEETSIAASNDLDEYLIKSLKEQGAQINIWGVGTNLVSASDQPALGGVYKLTALRDEKGEWEYKIKLSEQAGKINVPGILQVRRFRDSKGFLGDMVYDEQLGYELPSTMIDPADFTKRKLIQADWQSEELLVPIFRKGQCVYAKPSLDATRRRAKEELAMLHPTIKRFENPHNYPVGLEEKLFQLRADRVLKMKNL
ncbi:MAG TPA: nicotinate phosphoribosyltransferase [Catalimonadaceae bacterium]|nr:nicotinate phosphoribosyltransferase [Catalimonadaceae bacterium]HPI12668.1 nicotinate phosphoribosyltransferase [Catalimonadaceae bacterium]